MERILNKLIEKGWKPFGDNNVIRVKYGYSVHFLCRPIVNFVLDGYAEATVPLKEILTSRSSGLWQFVCENGMVEKGGLFWELGYSSGEIDLESRRRRQDYEYRLIRSALFDEDKLEDFLLQNINPEGN